MTNRFMFLHTKLENRKEYIRIAFIGKLYLQVHLIEIKNMYPPVFILK